MKCHMATYQDVMMTTYDFVYKTYIISYCLYKSYLQSGRHDVPTVKIQLFSDFQ